MRVLYASINQEWLKKVLGEFGWIDRNHRPYFIDPYGKARALFAVMFKKRLAGVVWVNVCCPLKGFLGYE